MPQLSCPDVNVLRRYLQGISTETEASSVESHLLLCQACQTQVDTLGHGSDSFISDLIRATAAPSLQYLGGAYYTQGDRNSSPTGVGDERERSSVPQPLSGLRVIRDYQIIDCIGQGGMGCVYRAIHQRLNRIVALKILQADRVGSPEAIVRFSREMKVLANLVHPCIVQAFDGGDHEGMPYFVMELIDGVDLQKLIRNGGPLPVPEACQIIRKAAGALQFAHDQNVIHRDVKPSNLMVTTSGNVKLLDLGLAQIFGAATEDAISRTGQIVGTLSYMAPEQIAGGRPVDQRSDVFSLGVTFYELLIGRRPYEGMSTSFIELLDARPDVSPELLTLLSEMISLSATDRPDTMAEVEQRLGAICPEVSLMTFASRYFRGADSRVSPPVQASGLGPFSSGRPAAGSQVEVVLPLSTGQRKRRSITSRSAMATALGGALLATSLWFAFFGNPADGGPTPEPEAKIAPVHFSPNPLASQWIAKKKVIASNVETERAYVVEAEMELPVGSYELRFLSPPVNLQHDRMSFDVMHGVVNVFDVNFIPSTPFMVPDLPSEVGAFARYYGSIQWEGHEKIEYDLYMTLLAEERDSDVVIAKWFEIEAITKHPAGDFKETAYIKLDMDKWTMGTFQVNDGWVIVGTPAITSFRQQFLPGSKTNEWMVRFSMQRDELRNLSEETGLPLPEHRVSIQDYIALFFGDDQSANANHVAVLRAKLGAFPPSHCLDESEFDPRLQTCYCVSSRDDYKDVNSHGYTMVRSQSDGSNPFGFVFLDVNMTDFKAHCKLKLAGTRKFDPRQKRGELDQMRQNLLEHLEEPSRLLVANPVHNALGGDIIASVAPEDAPSTTVVDKNAAEVPTPPSVKSLGAFDVAWLPETPHSIKYTGTIKRGERLENVQLTVKLLDYQQIENGRQGAWIEVEVSSAQGTSSHWEAIRVLIDADAYRSSEKFDIKDGWVAFGKPEFVYPFPLDGDLETLVDKRLQHRAVGGDELNTGSIGVAHALHMIFKADLKPATEISLLRSSVVSLIVANLGQSRVSEPASHPSKSGSIACLRTHSPELYDFYRSDQIPFGFVLVSLKAKNIDIKLEIDNKGEPLTSFDSKFGTLENITKLAKAHQQRISELNRRNWRVWSWGDPGRGSNYKAWAEFGGTFEMDNKRYLLLRDDENEIRIPVNLLTAASRASMEQGRFWESLGRQLVILDRDASQVKFQETKLPNKIIFHDLSSQFSVRSDSEWFKRLVAGEKRKVTAEQMTKEWKAFAGYVRAK